MSDRILLLEELTYIAGNDQLLHENLIEQMVGKYGENRILIAKMYQILKNNKLILPFIQDVESAIIDYIVREEMSHEKTYYGAILYAAHLFETTPTYIKYKVNQSKMVLQNIG